MNSGQQKCGLAELLALSHSEFDTQIKEMSLKDLLDTISTLQKEMSKEQENFNSLSAELSSLNKKSQQYKQISKEMTESQARLTALMDRSMKCFQQQGNQSTSTKFPNVYRRNSLKETSKPEKLPVNKPVQRNMSARIPSKEMEITRSTPNLKTTTNKPVFLKTLTDVNASKLEVKKFNGIPNNTSEKKPIQVFQNGTVHANGQKGEQNLMDKKQPSVKSTATFNMQKSKSNEFLHNISSPRNEKENSVFDSTNKPAPNFNVILRKTNRSLVDNEEQENNFRHSVDFDLRGSSKSPVPNLSNKSAESETRKIPDVKVSSTQQQKADVMLAFDKKVATSVESLQKETLKQNQNNTTKTEAVKQVNEIQNLKQNNTTKKVEVKQSKETQNTTKNVEVKQVKETQNTTKDVEVKQGKVTQNTTKTLEIKQVKETQNTAKNGEVKQVKETQNKPTVKSSIQFRPTTAIEAKAVSTGERQNLLQQIQNFKRKPQPEEEGKTVVNEQDGNTQVPDIIKSSIKKDKAWPSMSESTQTRIQRLRELEQKRLEKQARMLEQRNSEPVPMPKFESGLKSSFQTDTYSNLDNVPKTENSGNIIDKIERNKKEVSAEKVAPSEYLTAHSESVKVIDSPTKIDSIREQSDGAKNTKVFVEPVRTLSTSYVSGPLSPTSAEKTKISVVRKMKLDSLPTVKTTSSEHVLGSKMSETESPVASKVISHTISENTDEKKDDIVLSKKSGMDLSVLPDGLEKGYSSLSREDSGRKSQTCKPGENVCTGRSASITRDISPANKSENISSIAEELVSTCTTPVSSSNLSYMTCETKTVKSPTKPMTSDSEIALSSSISAESESATASGTKVTRENVEKGPIDTSKQSICAEGEKVNEAEGSSFRLGTLAMKQTLEVSAKIEEKFSSIKDDVHSQMAKLEELQRQREERKKSPQEDELSHLSVRERFFRNQSIGRSSRNAKPQSIPEQIRASRLSRRNSENLIPRTNSPGKAAEAESPPTARRRSRLQQSSVDRLRRRTIDTVPALFSSSNVHDVPKERSKPMAVVDIDSLDKAFSRPDKERFSRLDELDRIRVQNREAVKRRDSAPTLVDAEDTGTLASRIDFPSSLIVNRGSTENIAQYPIHEHLETSFLPSRLITSSTEDVASRRRELLRSTSFDRPSVTSHSRSTLRPSYSESRLFPLDGGRLSHSGILSMSTDTEHSQLQQSNVQHSVVNEETDETPVYREGSPQGTPVIDPEGRTHWVAPASLRLSTYLSVMDRLENRNRSASFDLVPSYHHQPINLSNNLLDEINHDHFLANCFDKKYTLKERCALIREKIYGKSTKTERGKPDGASHETDNSKDKSEATLA